MTAPPLPSYTAPPSNDGVVMSDKVYCLLGSINKLNIIRRADKNY